MTEHQNDPSGQQPSYGQQPSSGDQPSYGQQPSYGDQPSYGQQSSYGQQPSYGDQSSYGQPEYGQPTYGQPAYGQQPQYAAAPYGQQPAYGGYGQPVPGGRPARPGGVVASAVFGFIFGALGVLVTILFFFGAAAAGGASAELDEQLPGFGDVAGFAAGLFVVFGILALAWTVLMIWGSVWALTGRSRVLQIVAGSISIAVTLFMFLGGLSNASENGAAGGLILGLVLLIVAILIVVLVSNRTAGQFFAANRALRGR